MLKAILVLYDYYNIIKCVYDVKNVSDLAEFVEKVTGQAREDDEFKELQDILKKLDSKPKTVYRTYDVVSNT